MIEITNYKTLIAISFLAILLFLEHLFPFIEHQKQIFKIKNIGLGLINALLTTLFFSSAFLVASEFQGLFDFIRLQTIIEFILFFLLFDLWMYVWHVMNHKIPFFWQFHLVHHTDKQMNVTTAQRFHYGEIFFSNIFRLLLIPVLGIPFVWIIYYEMVLLPVIYFHHSNLVLPKKIDKIMRIFIASPDMHKVHHSNKRIETDSNYGSIFSFWDRLFSTYTTPRKKITYGIKGVNEKKSHTLTGMLDTPFKK